MRGFSYETAGSVADALRLAGDGAAYLAGGTTLVDLMKLDVMTPVRIVDINKLPLRGVRFGVDGLRIGALERMSDVARVPVVRQAYPVTAQALASSASPQLRNMASIGGNLLQAHPTASASRWTGCGHNLATPHTRRRRTPAAPAPPQPTVPPCRPPPTPR